MSITAILEGKLVLAQFAHALVGIEHDVAGGRLQIAAEDFHEGGLAAAVGADQAVAVAIAEFDGNVFEQRLGAELHGNIGCGNQNLRPKKWSKNPYIIRFFTNSEYLKPSR